jgi:hypothetical protein
MSNQWNASINVANVAARNVGGGYAEPETGPYKVKIVSTEMYEKEGRQSVKFQTAIVGGDFEGTETRLFIGLDLTKVGNQRSWKTAMLSCGYTAEQVDVGDIQIGADTFDGKEAYIYYKARDPNDATSQSDRQFITPQQFATLTGATAAPVAAASAKGKIGAPAAKPAAAPAMNVTSTPKPSGNAASIRNMLGK